jgi:heat shock protein HtpX
MKRSGYAGDFGLSVRMVLATIVLIVVYAPLVLCAAGVLLLFPSPLRWALVVAAAVGIPLAVSELAERAVLATVSARVVDARDEPWLSQAVARLSAAANVPEPRIAVSDSAVPNALAAGRSRRRSVIIVTRGLIERLEPEELEAVLAHELSHIAHRDAVLMTVLGLPALGLRRLLRWWVRTPLVLFLPMLFLAWLAYALATLALMSLSRYRELVADRGAAVLTGTPEQLMSALQKIAESLPLIPDGDLRAALGANAFFIVPSMPSDEGLHLDPLRIFPTHPPLKRRLEALGELARNLGRRSVQDERAERRPADGLNPFAPASFVAAVAAWTMVSMTVIDVVQNRTISVPAPMLLLPPAVWIVGVFLGVQALGRAQRSGRASSSPRLRSSCCSGRSAWPSPAPSRSPAPSCCWGSRRARRAMPGTNLTG